ncbi:hypothetical protein N657DRAFT_204899 [Parathielavia appendiculata]|uniref:Uncharacterized protein n=1 Tax=Parathielavia appendiculata TaxID=2587402 RepID=A0AAN6U6Y6_9PEZI|nr:hypothetical protein N657DRAFT_204899 [Parathielavia appendiculata]
MRWMVRGSADLDAVISGIGSLCCVMQVCKRVALRLGSRGTLVSEEEWRDSAVVWLDLCPRFIRGFSSGGPSRRTQLCHGGHDYRYYQVLTGGTRKCRPTFLTIFPVSFLCNSLFFCRGTSIMWGVKPYTKQHFS